MVAVADPFFYSEKFYLLLEINKFFFRHFTEVISDFEEVNWTDAFHNKNGNNHTLV